MIIIPLAAQKYSRGHDYLNLSKPSSSVISERIHPRAMIRSWARIWATWLQVLHYDFLLFFNRSMFLSHILRRHDVLPKTLGCFHNRVSHNKWNKLPFTKKHLVVSSNVSFLSRVLWTSGIVLWTKSESRGYHSWVDNGHLQWVTIFNFQGRQHEQWNFW
jgi:hypothetical protein